MEVDYEHDPQAATTHKKLVTLLVLRLCENLSETVSLQTRLVNASILSSRSGL